MKTIKKYFSIIKPLIFLFLLLIAASLSLFIINFIVNIILGLYTGEFDFGQEIIFSIPHLDSLLVEVIVMVVYFVWYRRIKKKESIANKRKITKKDIGFLLTWGTGIMFFENGLVDLMFFVMEDYFPQLVADYINMMSYLYEGSIVLLAIRVAIVAPIFEELICRGVILKKARDIMPFYAANITQAILFALIHMNIIQMLYAFPLGLIFGYITMKYESIIPAILLHALFNGFSVISVAYNKAAEKPIDISIWLILGLTIIGGLIFVSGYFKLKSNMYIEENTAKEIQV